MKYIFDNINNYTNKQYESFFKELKEEKQKHIKNLLNDEEKKRSILGEILLKKLLSESNFDYDLTEFLINTNGKPYIKDNTIYFNISHSHNYVVCVISKYQIGIDIEHVRPISLNTIKRWTNQDEYNYIMQDENDLYKRLFTIWTIKEAYIKCLGLNVAYVKDCSLDLDNGINYSSKNTKLFLLNDIDNYIIAICELTEKES